MEPIAVTVRGEGRWVLVHRCLDCGRLRLNKTAGDDNALPTRAATTRSTGGGDVAEWHHESKVDLAPARMMRAAASRAAPSG